MVLVRGAGQVASHLPSTPLQTSRNLGCRFLRAQYSASAAGDLASQPSLHMLALDGANRTSLSKSGIGASGVWLSLESSVRCDGHPRSRGTAPKRRPRQQPSVAAHRLFGGRPYRRSASGVAATSGLARTRGQLQDPAAPRRPAVGRAGQSRAAACARPGGTGLSAPELSVQGGRRGAPRTGSHGPPAPLALPNAAVGRHQLRDPHAVLLGEAGVPEDLGPRQVSAAACCAQGAGRARSSPDARGHPGVTCGRDTPFNLMLLRVPAFVCPTTTPHPCPWSTLATHMSLINFIQG